MSITRVNKYYSNSLSYYSYIIGEDIVSVDRVVVHTKKPHMFFNSKVKLIRYVIRWIKPIGLPLFIPARLRREILFK